MKKRPVGRPPHADKERRSVLALRLTPPERAELARAARRAKVPVSVYIRNAALAAARKGS